MSTQSRIIHNNQKGECPSTGKWISKMWHFHKMAYLLFTNKKNYGHLPQHEEPENKQTNKPKDDLWNDSIYSNAQKRQICGDRMYINGCLGLEVRMGIIDYKWAKGFY